MDHSECQRCREHHKYTPATTVHHVNYVRKHPDMALEIWYEWHGVRKRNLVHNINAIDGLCDHTTNPDFALESGQKAQKKAYTPGRKN